MLNLLIEEEGVISCTMAMEHIRATSEIQHLDKAIADLKSTIITLSTKSPNDKQYLRSQIRQSISALQD